MRRRSAAAEHGLAAVLALAVFAPVLRPGYVLSYDMVATPRVPFTAATLGWGDGLPRAVPQDAVVAVLTTVVPGWLVQLIALVAAVWLAVVGAARLVPSERIATRLVAGAAYGWNAFVAERLVIGHWGLLLGYAALPWIVRAARRFRVAPLLGWSALAAITPTGGLIAVVTAAAVLLWPSDRSDDDVRRHRVLATLGVAALNAPWVLAGAVARVSAVSDPEGVGAFAARAENWSGTLGAVLGLGGIWNAEVVPTSRTQVTAPLFTVLVLIVAAVGVRHLANTPLLVLGLGSLAVALAGAIPGGDHVLGALVAHVPGAGLLRDGQKFLAPFALLLALCFARGIESTTRALRDRTPSALRDRTTSALRDRATSRNTRPIAVAVGVVALLFPIAALPDLAWGAAGRLHSVRYPDDWDAVEKILAADPHGEAAVLPFSAFRAFSWNGDRTALDPAPRYFPVDVVVDDALPVGGAPVRGESPRANAVRDALAGNESLTTVGIRWIVVERDTPGPVPAGALSGYHEFWTGRNLALYRAGPATVPPQDSETVRVVTVGFGYAVPIGVLVFALTSWALTRSWRHSEKTG